MPMARSFFAVTGPTPHSASTGSFCRKASTRSGGTTVRPSGFFQPEAILARNLFGATPAEAVRRQLSPDPPLQLPGDLGGERLAPEIFGDVQVGLVQGERLHQRRGGAQDRHHPL